MTMLPVIIIGLLAYIIASVVIGILRDNAWQKGAEYGRKQQEDFINLKIRQDGYILDGYRVRETKELECGCILRCQGHAEGFYGGAKEI